MYIPFSRSSSIGNYSFCEVQYFLTYNLGYNSGSNSKARAGSAAHKVLECLAIAKKYLQDNPECSEIEIDGDSIGKMKYSVEDFYKVTELSFRDINTINKGRINKSIYTYDCLIPENHSRVGVEVVEDLIAKSIAYYGREEEGVFENTQQRDIANFSWIPLELFNREYDPRKRNIYCPEKPFNIPIDSYWSYYNFTLKDVDIVGQFSVKGTIDLITQIGPDSLEIIDWKTGSRRCWNSGVMKDYKYLQSDKQLLLYYYAARKTFPQFKNILITIMFIRDGGSFSLCFDDSDLIRAEKMLEDHFHEVSNNRMPKMIHPQQKDFKCQKLCSFYKNSLPNTQENICKHITREIRDKGIEKVVDHYISEGFSLNKYNSPGA